MSPIFGKRPDPTNAAGNESQRRDALLAITNGIRRLRGLPPNAPLQRTCPNGHFVSPETRTCPFCGYRFF
jgi:hypothetical protein